jgi:hypothetical protein
LAGDTNNIWMSEDPRYSRAGVGYPAWLPAADAARQERIRQGRMLFDGRHREYYLAEGRTQFSFRDVKKHGGGVAPLYVTNNLLRLVAMKAADLLFGEVPQLASDDQAAQDKIADIVKRSGLHQVVYQAALDASVEGEAFLEAVLFGGLVYIQQVPGEEITPVGKIQPDGQYASFIRRTTEYVGKKQLLLEQTYTAGAIERHCFDVTEGKKVEVGLEQWPGFAAKAKSGEWIAETVSTGIAWNTITWVPNLMVRRRAVSDFDGVVELQDTANAKASQLAVVILKHAHPRLLAPEQLFDQNGNLPDAEVLVSRAGEKAEYLTWDAQLDAAQKDLARVINLLLIATETSPVLLGMKEGAAPDAYRKVRLEAFNSLTKAARRAVYWTEGLRTAITSALMLAGTSPQEQYAYSESEITVQLRDGIPSDALDDANRLATLIAAGIVDEQWCLEQLLPDPAGVAEVLERVKARKAEQAATIQLMQPEPGMDAGNPNDETRITNQIRNPKSEIGNLDTETDASSQ